MTTNQYFQRIGFIFFAKTLLAVAAMGLLGSVALAQQTFHPLPFAEGTSSMSASLEDLAKLQQRGCWDDLYHHTDRLLSNMTWVPAGTVGPAIDPYDPGLHHYSIVFKAKGFRVKDQVVRFTLHGVEHGSRNSDLQDFASCRPSGAPNQRLYGLPGDSGEELREIFIRDLREKKLDVVLLTTYSSTRLVNPLEDQAPGVLQTVLAALPALTLIREVGEAPEYQSVPKNPTFKAVMSQLELPHRRASLEINDILVIKPNGGSGGPTPSDGTTGATASESVDSGSADGGNGTNGGANGAGGGQEASGQKKAEGPKPTEVTGKFQFTNLPLRHWSFGLTSSFLLGESFGSTRAKLNDDGVIVSDPLSGPLTMAVVNYHPWAYDSETEALTKAERFRFFGGPVLTPEFGFGGGAGYELVRGFSVNAGFAAMFVNKVKTGEDLNMKALSDDPFKSGLTGIFFIGAGYNFK